MKIIVLIFILFLIVRQYSLSKKCNIQRHLGDGYDYAHFSKITGGNYLLFPELLITRPRRFVLNAGESIYIPPKWWHWIRTKKNTTAVSFWSHDALVCEIPYKFEAENKHVHNGIIEKINNKINSGSCKKWNNDDNSFDVSNSDDYLITLPGYVSAVEHVNSEFLEYIDDSIVPKILVNPVKNLWVTTVKPHDTGLHYDDPHGVLTVLTGVKYITLFPPSDTKYLHAHGIIPSWVSDPRQVEYNIYYQIKVLPSTSYPSSRLLYESLKNAKYRDNIIKNIGWYEKGTVWGCKQMYSSSDMRWELYSYHYDINSHEPEKPDDNTIINSVDFYDTYKVIGDDTHEYYCLGDMSIPFYGMGTTNNKILEGKFILDEHENFKRNASIYFKTVGFNKVPLYLLNKYRCKHLVIWNKFNKTYFIQYLGISLPDFIDFLSTHNYPIYLVEHVKSNRDRYTDIIHEITIVYDENGNVVRSGFYGIL